ncbi:DNA-deoxyinosine glycosylase [Undibacterium amnicola]|uniref:DNA-deoxyinosine glycosylase n=1 Tax=Undibacterium amnicola TaxID=1834038 RepID=A0ABR6XVK2_9BURK|nr:DNA-deoxyinosine glycosylase [Undibacterium amnicola]MBC3832987.1 DNA-deoxyinosine glycosylase [Undibacterium amnicola]
MSAKSNLAAPNLATPKSATIKSSFAPVVDQNTRILILGSLPGDASLAQQQYYAHPQNRFWHLLSELVTVNLIVQDYPSRLQTLLQNHIGLWDVIAQAQRRGSLDSQIKERNDNDLLALVSTLPQLHTIAFNGTTAAKIGLKILQDKHTRYRILHLPSSSPAYTLKYEVKLRAWRSIVD